MNRLTARRIVKHRAFELAIIAVIIINAVFIGVESYGYDAIINTLLPPDEE